MKLLKTIGKVIALPFDLALILAKLLPIPIELASVLYCMENLLNGIKMYVYKKFNYRNV